MRSSSLLPLVVAATTALVGALLVGRADAPPAVRAVFGGVLLLYLTGYAVTEAFFAGRRLERTEHLAFSIGLSLCLGVLGGFVLDASGGLRADSWGALLGGMTIAACAIAAVRQPGRPEPGVEQERSRGRLPDIPQLAMLAAAGVVMVAALLVARLGVEQQPRPGFTQLWLVRDAAGAMAVGLTNAEGKAETFRVELTVDGLPLADWGAIELSGGEGWRAVLPVPDARRPISRVEAHAFRLDDEEPYRSATIVLRRDATVPDQGSAP